jgi:phosphoribosylformylglycinamidine synthase
MMKPQILILHVTGTNRDREAAWACEMAGGAPEIVHINQLIAGERRLADYWMLVLPGGFSYGDDLGAGKVWAVALRYRLADDLTAFIAAGKPVLGICNGFQALVKAGLLPGAVDEGRKAVDGGPWTVNVVRPPSTVHRPRPSQAVTLTRNDSARFECRWVYLQPQPVSPCIFTHGLAEMVYCPVAHGEGKFVAQDEETLAALEGQGLVALRYVGADGKTAGYPWNPNGSQGDIAGICNQTGNVLGLMPHPEDHIIAEQHPRCHRGERGMLGVPLFQNGVRYAAEL